MNKKLRAERIRLMTEKVKEQTGQSIDIVDEGKIFVLFYLGEARGYGLNQYVLICSLFTLNSQKSSSFKLKQRIILTFLT